MRFVMRSLSPLPIFLLGTVWMTSVLPAWAGGYSGGGGVCCRVAPQEAEAFLSLADTYRDGKFSVSHSDTAGASVKTGAGGEDASGYGASETSIKADSAVDSWKRSVQRGSASAANGEASGSGFSASFLKARTADGQYYMYKGYSSVGASAGPGGTSTSQAGFGRSTGGRF
jgi:hypothetical protein